MEMPLKHSGPPDLINQNPGEVDELSRVSMRFSLSTYCPAVTCLIVLPSLQQTPDEHHHDPRLYEGHEAVIQQPTPHNARTRGNTHPASDCELKPLRAAHAHICHYQWHSVAIPARCRQTPFPTFRAAGSLPPHIFCRFGQACRQSHR